MAPCPEEHRFENLQPLGALSPGAMISHYRIIEKIGAGGMGVVYRAEDTELGRTVALKFLAPQALGGQEDRARLRREAQAAAALDHPNICTVHEIGHAEGYTFIVMAYVEGQELKDRIAAGPLDVEEALRLAIQVARGLKAAHAKGIIHRDIKPANIIVTGDGSVKIMDFGIAKAAGETKLTGLGTTVGTVAYMSPEQTQGEEVDHRTDIWSLGVVLYQMLTGSLPFKGGYDQAIIYSILNEAPRPLRELRPDTPAWLEEIISRALAKKPEERYQDLDEFIADIEAQMARPRRRVGVKRLVPTVAAIAVAAVAVTAILWRRPKIVMEPERVYLAVLPFENKTGEPALDWMASGIPDNLTADLAQSKFFRVMSLERLHQVVAEIGKDLSELGTAEAIDLLGRATDLDAVAVGSFVKAGDLIRITMKIEDPHDQEVIGSAIVDDAESRLLDLIDRLSVETKQIFKLSQEEIDEDLERGAGLKRTRSVKAASDFSKGLEHSYRGAFLEAAQAFAAAIEADPDFAMAYAKASEAYKNLGYDQRAESLSLIAVDKVIEFTDRVPPADRTFIRANHADIINSPEQAIESYRDFIQAYPDDPEGYYKLGLTYESISQWDQAIENLRQALALDPKFGAARFELGKVLIQQDDLEPALTELESLLTYYRDIGNREGEATVVNAIGVIHRHRNEFEEAIGCFETSIRLKEELSDKRGVAASLGNLALVYKTVGKTDSALAALERSLEIKREIGDKLGISTALNKIAQIYELYGRYEEALGYYERSYEIREELGSKQLMASSLSDMAAVVYASTGEYKKAFLMDSTALALRRGIGDRTGEVHSLAHIAGGLRSRGFFEEASAKLREALAIGTELADQRLVASLQHELGRNCVERGKADSALIHYSRALEACQELDVQPLIGMILASRGSARRMEGSYLLALSDLERARQISQAVGDRLQLVTALLGKGRFFCDLGYWPGCDSTLAELESYRQSGMSYDQRLELRLHQAKLLSAGDRLPEALEVAQATAADAKHLGLKIEGMLLAGELELEAGDAHGAEGTVEMALKEARQHSYRMYEAQGLRLLAQILAIQGKLDDAARSAEEALRMAGRLGINQYKYLITAGDVRLAAGQRAQALPLYTGALDGAAVTIKEECPAGLKSYYMEHLHVPYYVGLVNDLSRESGANHRIPDYTALFGLN
jgi:tetratricopeptide (TPR) repeat protein/tRNA A-37 threonylcarbamoyl transferase component Bud32